MSQHLRPCLLASVAALFTMAVAMAAPAQTPAQPAATPADAPQNHQSRPHHPHPNPVNLQALPKDLTGDQVIAIMHKYEAELGVECDYCHAKNAATGHLDFASDANPVKDRARVMIRMNDEINQRFLVQLKNPPAAHEVSCGTCHRGTAKPTVFMPPPDEHHPEAAPPAGTPPQ
jgi:hypothetical protein